MLAYLTEAALRSFLLGFAVWAALKFLRVQNPQARMTAWTGVLVASLAMPALMHWATVTVPHNPQAPAVSVAQLSAAARSSEAQPSPPVAPSAQAAPAAGPPGGAAAARHETDADAPSESAAASPLSSSNVDWQKLAGGFYLAVAGGLLLRLAAGLVLTWRLLRRSKLIKEPWTAGMDVRVSAAARTPL